MSNATMHTINNGKTDKIARYGWVMRDEPGEFRHINKTVLFIAEEYQRALIESKVREITADWSWFGCGAILVAYRDGKYWVVDGQHRVIAAMRRSDINHLPCLVFQTDSLVDEAKAFLVSNTGRKPVTTFGKLKAQVIAGDEDAVFVTSTIQGLGLRISGSTIGPMGIKCIASCQKLAKNNRGHFVEAITLAAELSSLGKLPVNERVLNSLYYFDANLEGGLRDARLRKRIRDIGAPALLVAVNRAASFYASGGTKIWAEGMLQIVNKGLRNPFVFKGAVTASLNS